MANVGVPYPGLVPLPGRVLTGCVGPGCDGRAMDELLMLHGEDRHCADCGTVTIFLPLEGEDWVCTACDGAVNVPGLAA